AGTGHTREMEAHQISALRFTIGALLLTALAVQVAFTPLAARSLASSYPEVAYLAVPYTIAIGAAFIGFDVDERGYSGPGLCRISSRRRLRALRIHRECRWSAGTAGAHRLRQFRSQRAIPAAASQRLAGTRVSASRPPRRNGNTSFLSSGARSDRCSPGSTHSVCSISARGAATSM